MTVEMIQIGDTKNYEVILRDGEKVVEKTPPVSRIAAHMVFLQACAHFHPKAEKKEN